MKTILSVLSLIFLVGIAPADVSNDKKDQPVGKTTWSNGPQETLLLLKKIDQVEAKQLTTDAASAEPAQNK